MPTEYRKDFFQTMKKKIIAGVCVLVLAAGAAGGWYYYKNYAGEATKAATDENQVYMEKVSVITGTGALGVTQRYVGVVATQESKNINLDSDKTLDVIYVEEGDEVKAGDPLFSYDVEAMQRKVQEADLELEEMNNQLQTLQKQLAELQTQAAKAKADEQQAYNLEILSAQNSISKQNYNISVKQIERAQLEKDIGSAIVYSDIDGIVKNINQTASSQSDTGSDSTGAFMTIIESGDYRIKATCNEMNIYNISVGQAVLVRPRSDEAKIYTGTVEKIDSEPTSSGNSNYGSDSETSSKYNFYVKISEEMDLMLGQHVIVEPDVGQNDKKEGLWLPEYYLVQNDDGSYYVWAKGEDGLAHKAEVTLGDYDEGESEYEVLSGITENDYIAFPEDVVTDGMTVIDSE